MTATIAKHPGRTSAQRSILNAIGCGNSSPLMLRNTRNALLRNGLIVRIGVHIAGTRWSEVRLQEYEMPIPVHMAWCSYHAAKGKSA